MFTFPKKLDLAQIPTPIEPLPQLSSDWNIDLRVKRDDLTGSHLSGNKIRKLDYLLADAIDQGCDTVITCGAVNSNHARATALASRRLGLDSYLILAGDPPTHAAGNLQLDLLAGAQVEFIPQKTYIIDANHLLNQKAAELQEQGKKPYIIPTGGSNAVGAMGYAHAMQEISQQCHEENWHPDTIVCAVGSGGTYTGLLLGQQLVSSNAQLIGIIVCSTTDYFKNKIIQDWHGIQSKFNNIKDIDERQIKLIDGYTAGRYAKTNPEQLDFLRFVAQQEALILDPVYTNKAFFGLYQEIQKGVIQKNSKVLFIHTGGIFGLSAFNQIMTDHWSSVNYWKSN